MNRFTNKGMYPFEEFMTGLNWDYPDMPKRKMFKVDIKEVEDRYILLADLPGFKKEDISVEYENRNLTISAKKEAELDEKTEKYIIQERTSDVIYRRFYIDGINEERVEVEYHDGVLKITLPKENSSKNGKRFEIK